MSLFTKKISLNELPNGLKMMQWCLLFCCWNMEKIVRKNDQKERDNKFVALGNPSKRNGVPVQ